MMDYRLPYYMAYPMPLQYDDDRMEQRDLDYMQSMYPETARRILPYVQDECDRMAYEGSVVFDEYPDQLQLQMMCRRVFERVRNMEEIERGMENEEPQPEEQMESQQMRGRNREKDDRLRDLVQVLLFQELFRRRRDRRNYRRRFY